jgi:hypothetical protein
MNLGATMFHARSRRQTIALSHSRKSVHICPPLHNLHYLTTLHTPASHPSGLQGGAKTWIFCKAPPLHVKDMPPARQPERPCLQIIKGFEDTIRQCRENASLRVAPECVDDMEDILKLLKQEYPLPCNWFGGVICGHVAGVRREGASIVEVADDDACDEFEVDDFVVVATTSDEDQSFWLAKVVRVDSDELLVAWYDASKIFGCYKPAKGGDQGRHTQGVSPDCCMGVTVVKDKRSPTGMVIKTDMYGTEESRINLAMSHGRQVAEQMDSQNHVMF